LSCSCSVCAGKPLDPTIAQPYYRVPEPSGNDHPRQSPTVCPSSMCFPVFSSPTATVEVVNEHNGWVPRDFWLELCEKEAIIDFHRKNPLEGYRRLTFMMLDADVVAVSPASVWRVLKQAGLLERWKAKPSRKGTGFDQPLQPLSRSSPAAGDQRRQRVTVALHQSAKDHPVLGRMTEKPSSGSTLSMRVASIDRRGRGRKSANCYHKSACAGATDYRGGSRSSRNTSRLPTGKTIGHRATTSPRPNRFLLSVSIRKNPSVSCH
jgi:hypothetical protein